MSFLSPLPDAGGGSKILISPGNLLTSPLGLCNWAASPTQPKPSPHFAVREGRLSLERLLDEASGSQNSSQKQPLDVFGASKAGLAKVNSAKQLDAFASLPGQPRPQCGAAMDVETKQFEDAADSLTAKLQEQLMPWLKQQVQEVLAGAKGAVDLEAELAGVNTKLQAALRQEEIMTRAASSFAEALPSMLAKQLRDSQELSMEGSISAPKTLQHGAHADPQAKMVSTSAASDSSQSEHEEEQQATSAMKTVARVSRIDSMHVEGQEEEEEAERPVKRMCYEVAMPVPSPATVQYLMAMPELPALSAPVSAAAAAAAAAETKKRRTHYVKLRELESCIQDARVVAQHLHHAVHSAEIQHASIMEENRQLWNAVAHINTSMHAGRAALLAAAFQQGPTPQPPATEPAAAADAPIGVSPGLADMFVGSPDPLCLAEACGMLFSPAPAKLAKEAPANKPRKLFHEEMACCGVDAGMPGLPLLGDIPMPKLQFGQ